MAALFIFPFFGPAWGIPINTTIVVPPDASNHGDRDLLCTPPKWTDIAIFFLGNYVAHAATIVTSPGESTLSVAIATIYALLFPVTGVVRGVKAIMSRAILGNTDLEKAARAGALYVVKRGRSKDCEYLLPSSILICCSYQ
jgi:hypothetical protein